MKFRLFILITGLVFFLCPFLVAAVPSSDNAADLYIKCFQRFKKPDNTLWKQVTGLPTATGKPSPEVVAFLEEQRKNSLIADIEAASKAKNCDWGLDYSKGLELSVPYLSETKLIAQLLRADSALAATRGDYETAINRNLAIWRMGHHLGMGKTTVEFLVSIALVSMGSEGLRQTVGTCTIDSARLALLKAELLTELYRLPSIKDIILSEKKMILLELPKMTLEKLGVFTQTTGSSEEKQKSQSRKYFKADDPNTPDPAWIASSTQYMENYYASILVALDKPYPVATAEIKQAAEKTQKDFAAGNDAAFLTACFLPSWEKMYNISTRIRTQGNALLAALDIYIAAKQTGQFPKELPNTPYVDRFSGKPFIYETTPNGFRLRCQQEEEKKTWEWEYMVKQP